MRLISPLEDNKTDSLVFSFSGLLHQEYNLDGPEPDFLTWANKVLFADLGTAYDWYALDGLNQEEREAWRLYHDAVEATKNLLELYTDNPRLFQKIARQLSFLPCLMSWHPGAERFNRQLLEFAQVGQQSMYGELRRNARHIVRQSWPVRYAYAIMATIELTLDTHAEDLPVWAEIYGYGVKHPVSLDPYLATMERLGWDEAKKRRELPKYQGLYQILPMWTKGLGKLRRPFNAAHVIDYWRTGKKMVLEEMPDFHLRPEWKQYRDERAYSSGAKKGAIQHAIFKDILAALKTIAGANKRRKLSSVAK